MARPSFSHSGFGSWAAKLSLASCCLWLSACAAGGATSTEQPAASDNSPSKYSKRNPWTDCYREFKPLGVPSVDLKQLTKRCAEELGMSPLSPIFTGKQAATDPVAIFSFTASQPGVCYRIIAVGDSKVQDLDLLLRGPGLEPIAGDLTHDAWPILPPAMPLCLQELGVYELEVSVNAGSGDFALQVWGGQ